MKHNLFSRFISVLLAVVMLAGLMSMPSLADTVTGTDTAATDNVNITEDDTEVDSAPAALSEEDGEGDKEPADSNEGSEPTDDTETTGDVQEPEEGTEDTQEPADTTEGTENTQEPADTNEGTGDVQNPDENAGDTTDDTQDEGAEQEPAEDTQESVNEEESAGQDTQEPEQSEEDSASVELIAEDTAYTAQLDAITVMVKAPAGSLPVNSELVVAAAADEAAAGQLMEQNGITYDGYKALDVHFESDGVEVEPTAPVKVAISASDLVPADTQSTVYHFVENEAGEVVKVEPMTMIDPDEILASVQQSAQPQAGAQTFAAAPRKAMAANIAPSEDEEQSDEQETASVLFAFEVNSFSTFTITWTLESEDGIEIKLPITLRLLGDDGQDLGSVVTEPISIEKDDIDNVVNLDEAVKTSGTRDSLPFRKMARRIITVMLLLLSRAILRFPLRLILSKTCMRD